MKNKCLLFFIVVTMFCTAQEKEYNSTKIRVNNFVNGTLITPYSDEAVPLIIFIMDSGAVNRDGNDRMSKNDTFKKLSRALAKLGIATFSYDKRLFSIDKLGIQEHQITLNDFIKDASSVIDYFKTNGTYSKIVIAGHGQGSLVGMIAAREKADAFISLMGNGHSIDQVIIEQISKQAPGLDKSASNAFQQLKQGNRATGYDPALASIFGPKVQSFMRSWLQYTPTEEIAKLDIPILIMHGDKDIQVDIFQSELLKEAKPEASLLIIKNMNHILREIEGTRLENHKSYNEYWRVIMPEAIEGIANFVNQTEQTAIKN